MSEDPIVEALREIQNIVKLIEEKGKDQLKGEKLVELVRQVDVLDKKVNAFIHETENLFALDKLESGKRRELRETVPEDVAGPIRDALQKAAELKNHVQQLRKQNLDALPKDKFPPELQQQAEEKKTEEQAKDPSVEEKKTSFRRFGTRKDWKQL